MELSLGKLYHGSGSVDNPKPSTYTADNSRSSFAFILFRYKAVSYSIWSISVGPFLGKWVERAGDATASEMSNNIFVGSACGAPYRVLRHIVGYGRPWITGWPTALLNTPMFWVPKRAVSSQQQPKNPTNQQLPRSSNPISPEILSADPDGAPNSELWRHPPLHVRVWIRLPHASKGKKKRRKGTRPYAGRHRPEPNLGAQNPNKSDSLSDTKRVHFYRACAVYTCAAIGVRLSFPTRQGKVLNVINKMAPLHFF